MKPVIGIIACGYTDSRQFVSQSYIEALESFGALPVVLPILTVSGRSIRQDFQQYLELCGGFLFCGGDDITPVFFEEEPFNSSGVTDIKTDIFQLSLMEYVLSSQKPILAVCRGMQVLNIALGGTIYQDLSLRTETTFSHMQHSLRRSDISHKVSFTPGSILYNICGESAYTNSFHHQSVRLPGSRIAVTGTTSDGVIESIEVENHPFAVGVQWHPECMYRESREMQTLFSHFISSI